MSKYVFSIGIIPVQSFISEATRSRDLAAGSVLLGWITAKLLHHIADKMDNFYLRLPATSNQNLQSTKESSFKKIINEPNNYQIPNQASGFFETKGINNADQIFAELESVLANAWDDLITNVREKGPFSSKDAFFAKYIRDESKAPFQCIWCFQETAAENAIDEATALKEINEYYIQVKRARPIQHWTGKPISKCSQCGKREVIGPDTVTAWRAFKPELLEQTWVKDGARIDAKERLCATCLIKRFAGYLRKKATGSTMEIASREWLYHVEKFDDLKALVQSIKDTQESLHRLDQIPWYYDSHLRRLETDENRAIVDQIRQTQKKISTSLIEHSYLKKEPSQYLVALTFDGDDMGKNITPELSEQLAAFNQALSKYFTEENPRAEIFYLGGDEGLILLPLELLLPTANKIRSEFMKAFDGSLTISIGASIFSQDRPLGAGIRNAHEALEYAKKFPYHSNKLPKKNAMAITVQTASGNIFRTRSSWNSDDWPRFQKLLKLLWGNKESSARLSMAWPYEMERFLLQLPQPDEEDGDQNENWGSRDFRDAVSAEIKRLFYRKLEISNRDDKKEKLWSELHGDSWFDKSAVELYDDLSQQMHLLAFMARESSYRLTQHNEIPEVEHAEI